MYRKTTAQLSYGRLEIIEDGCDCYRDFYAHLGQYGEDQFRLYGNKETLAALIEYRYHIVPGKYIRQIGDMIFFFPSKTGLTGRIAASEWKIEHWYIGPVDGLVSFSICDKSIPAANLQRFRNSFGCWDAVRSLPKNPLLLYQYGRLYCVEHEKPAGRFWLKDITDPKDHPK